MKLFWYKDQPNFGDMLSPIIVRWLTGDNVKWAPPGSCDLVAIGSLLHFLDRGLPCGVWGTGNLHRALYWPNRWKVEAIRGPLSLEAVEGENWPYRPVMGDPALLAPLCLPESRQTLHRLGVIPHHHYTADPDIQRLCNEHGALLIDPEREPCDVVSDLCSCEAVASMSLHGVILADAYRIPRVWLISAIDPHKFVDYFAGAGVDHNGIMLTDKLTVEMCVSQAKTAMDAEVLARMQNRLSEALWRLL